MARLRVDELDAAEADGRPVPINGDHSDRFETLLAKDLPTRIAVDFAFVLLGGPLRLSEPHYGVPSDAFG